MLKRLGGATGDTYGASIEILETVVLLIPGRGFGL
jgi:cobalamin synthase